MSRPRYVDARWVAEQLGLSRRSVYRRSDPAVTADPIPSYEVGGRRIYDPNEVIAWVRRQRAGACTMASESTLTFGGDGE